LVVDVEERGRPEGSFFCEGRPGAGDPHCRAALRPSFPAGFRNEVQVISTILGADL
jgi:polyribonucleotide nucleotidyltransferase